MDAVCDPECPIEPTHWMPLPAAPDAAMLAASPGGQDVQNNLVVTTVPVVFDDTERDVAYDKIDRFLRNNLGDDDYDDYQSALEIVYSTPPDSPAHRAANVLMEAMEKITYADQDGICECCYSVMYVASKAFLTANKIIDGGE